MRRFYLTERLIKTMAHRVVSSVLLMFASIIMANAAFEELLQPMTELLKVTS